MNRVFAAAALALAVAGCRPAAAAPAVDPQIRALFDDYAKAMTDHDLGRSVAFYAPTFILADPAGHSVVTNDTARRQAVDRENAYYRDTLKMRSAKILSITDASTANHHHFVRTTWGCTFEKTGARVIEFPLSWVVEEIGGGPPKILVHVVEADEPRIFRENGLI